ncbi:MAG: DUF3006 domain-containing protein [Gemmatimonadota bacterium]
MATDERFVVVDRLEADIAVLVFDDGSAMRCFPSDLPEGASEGVVLSVIVDDSEGADLRTLAVDEAETSRRLDQARAVIDELRRRDPGGDVTL